MAIKNVFNDSGEFEIFDRFAAKADGYDAVNNKTLYNGYETGY